MNFFSTTAVVNGPGKRRFSRTRRRASVSSTIRSSEKFLRNRDTSTVASVSDVAVAREIHRTTSEVGPLFQQPQDGCAGPAAVV